MGGWNVMQKDLGYSFRLFVSYKEQKQIDETYSYSEEMCDFKWERNTYQKRECNGKPVCARYWDKWGPYNDCAPEKHCQSVWHEFHENLRWANPWSYNKLFGVTNNGCTPWFFGTSNNGKFYRKQVISPLLYKQFVMVENGEVMILVHGFNLVFHKKQKQSGHMMNQNFLAVQTVMNLYWIQVLLKSCHHVQMRAFPILLNLPHKMFPALTTLIRGLVLSSIKLILKEKRVSTLIHR